MSSCPGGIELREKTVKAKQLFSKQEQFMSRIEFIILNKASVEIYFTGVPAMDLLNGLKAGKRVSEKTN